ncbi:hypothetical protein FAZ95_00960 [Trinickia violacea]|uniref:Uncharacterized protein n=1 Tax=Trinickia violacea TaxID=2571746 RepID=A0A4P8ITX0_9BURK|nr:hypothetical protein [Trinickia violacea]QCP51597.1 hypothetical protein FAZ95_00960 [Trinickia violacea]
MRTLGGSHPEGDRMTRLARAAGLTLGTVHRMPCTLISVEPTFSSKAATRSISPFGRLDYRHLGGLPGSSVLYPRARQSASNRSLTSQQRPILS